MSQQFGYERDLSLYTHRPGFSAMQGAAVACRVSAPSCFCLPMDVWLHIFERIPPVGILRLARVRSCQSSRSLTQTFWYSNGPSFICRHAGTSTRSLIRVPSGSKFSISPASATVSSSQPSPWTRCPFSNCNTLPLPRLAFLDL